MSGEGTGEAPPETERPPPRQLPRAAFPTPRVSQRAASENHNCFLLMPLECVANAARVARRDAIRNGYATWAEESALRMRRVRD